MEKSEVGLIGLAVMGQNLALNFANKGISISVFNRTEKITRNFLDDNNDKQLLRGTYSIEEFIGSLSIPRKVFLLVKAGGPVDAVLESLFPYLDKGDIVIDSGNSFFRDTQERMERAQKKGVHFIGMGVSGGEKGALTGPSLMPGGDKNACNQIMPILMKIAAQKPEPCVAYMGEKGAGHFVKMAHNGIEYADMQLIAEVYHIVKNIYGYNNSQLRELFTKLNQSELSSYLIEITAKIFEKKDPQVKEKNYLIDSILDVAQGKGTGKWTVLESLELGCPITIISAALSARYLSTFKNERLLLAQMFNNEKTHKTLYKEGSKDVFSTIKGALLCGKILAYAQGLHMLSIASNTYKFELDLSLVTKVWRGGCIIRAKILEDIMKAYSCNNLQHLVFDETFLQLLRDNIEHLSNLVALAVKYHIGAPSLSSALSYFYGLKTGQGPAGLIQAQRDFFGAHRYQRIDQEGTFHTLWE